MTSDDDIRTDTGVMLDRQSLEFSAVRASGPGGQNVNKTSSAVQLQFDIANSDRLSPEQKSRLLNASDRRISSSGVITIKAQGSRSQDKNRQDAVVRLVEFIDRNLKTQKPRRKTRPGKAAVERRLRDKSARSRLKSSRRPPEDQDR